MEITSVNNEFVKETVKLQQKKYRIQTGLFLLEGQKSVEEAIDYGIDVKTVFVNKNYNFNKKCDAEIITTTEAVLKKISTTETAPEIVAVACQKKYDIEDLKNFKKVLLLENIKDYGNLGTILRTAKAMNQDAVILYGETVDLYNPKCVRASVGNLWKLPVYNIKDFTMLEKYFSKFERIATLPKSDESIYLKNYVAKTPYLIMFGAEADGLSKELINFSDKKVTIEMSDSVESLNLAVSVGISLYKIENK